jgi:hypothetical protein
MQNQYIVSLFMILALVVFSLLVVPFLGRAHADILTNALNQRIGNYNMYIRTVPPNPIAGHSTEILFAINTVNGEERVDQPIAINISKDGIRQEATHPIFVPYGHYVYKYIFKEPGRYALDIGIINDPDTGENITFTFPIQIYDPFGEYFAFSQTSPYSLPIGYIVLIVTASLVVITILVSIKIRNERSRKTSVHHSGAS